MSVDGASGEVERAVGQGKAGSEPVEERVDGEPGPDQGGASRGRGLTKFPTYDELIVESDMTDERKRYWLADP